MAWSLLIAHPFSFLSDVVIGDQRRMLLACRRKLVDTLEEKVMEAAATAARVRCGIEVLRTFSTDGFGRVERSWE